MSLEQIEAKLLTFLIMLYLLLSHLLHRCMRSMAHRPSTFSHHSLTSHTPDYASLPERVTLRLEWITVQHAHLLLQLLGYVLRRMIQRHHDVGHFRVGRRSHLVITCLLLFVRSRFGIVGLETGEDGHVALLHERMETEGTASLLLHGLVVELATHWHIHGWVASASKTCAMVAETWLVQAFPLETVSRQVLWAFSVFIEVTITEYANRETFNFIRHGARLLSTSGLGRATRSGRGWQLLGRFWASLFQAFDHIINVSFLYTSSIFILY